jgi:hypothetical protein
MYIGRQKRIFSLISRATFRYLVRSFFSASKRRANIVPFVAFLRQHCLRRVPTFGVDRPSRYLLKDNGCARCASLSRAPVVRPASPCQGPPRCANVVILRGERRNSGKLNAPSAFRSCKLVPTPFPAPRESAEKYRALFSHICGNYPFFSYILQIYLHMSKNSSIFAAKMKFRPIHDVKPDLCIGHI